MKIFSIALAGLMTVLACTVSTAQDAKPPKKILVFSKSSNYEHDAIKRNGTNLSVAEEILKNLGASNNLEFTFTKDGTLFTPENIAQYDAFFFYTTGELTQRGDDKNPPMTREGKAAFLAAIQEGKGFIGVHSATDTFHSPGNRDKGPARFRNDGTNVSPYVAMIGGEFIDHASEQRARMIPADTNFPGMGSLPPTFRLTDEWYSMKNFAPDLHVLLVQDTSSMRKTGGEYVYDRPNYPATWAHMYGKGRVFYSSMGHRLETWRNPVFQQILLGGINWAVHNVDADITPNMKEAAPDGDKLPVWHEDN